MASSSIQWRGTVDMGRNCTIYGNKVIEAVNQVAAYFAPVLETYARKNAPWTDRTSNARTGLHTWVEELSKDIVVLYLSHSVYYGIFLETRAAGRWSAVWPAIQAHLPKITAMLKSIFS